MSAEKRILAFLELAEKDAEATELFVAGSNRNAAYHLQQAIEKLLKAVLIARQIETTSEHRLEPLLDQLASDDPWLARLTPFAHYSVYATTFRYPTPGGRIANAPEIGVVRADNAAIRKLLVLARQELSGARS